MTKYYADAYRTGVWPAIVQDKLYLWARPHPANASASNDALGAPTGAGWVSITLSFSPALSNDQGLHRPRIPSGLLSLLPRRAASCSLPEPTRVLSLSPPG